MWQNMYSLAKNVRIDHKIIEMQFQILHSNTGTNKHLYKTNKIGKIVSPACRLCEMHVKTIEHLFYECFVVKTFWFNLIKVRNRSHTRILEINYKSILFGYNVNNAK